MQFKFNVKNKKLALCGAGAACLALLLAALYGSYSAGYRAGSDAIRVPPASEHLIDANSTGSLADALDDPGQTVDFGDFWKTWNILDKNFVPSSSTTPATSTTEAHIAGAIDGLVRSYDDPYTIFIPKQQATAFKEQVNAEFQGIGAVLQTLDGMVTVVGLIPGSPAAKKGLVPGDRILAVDGTATNGQSLDDIISHIRGPEGTVVTLTIEHAKSQQEFSLPITRGTVVIPTTATRVVTAAKSVIASAIANAKQAAQQAGSSVAQALGLEQKKEEQAASQQFFVLQLATFAKSSTDAFVSDLGRFAKSGSPYLIIDLRNNPGGYIDTAVDLASYFLPKGELIVTQRTGANGTVTEYRSLGYDLLKDVPSSKRRIVVLVNRNSASASEILAGALQDQGAALVVGETSFGKGSVQTLVDIGNIGSLKVTIARWYTPSGRNISHEGITPNVTVNLQDPKYASSTDPYIDAATEVLLNDSLWQKN